MKIKGWSVAGLLRQQLLNKLQISRRAPPDVHPILKRPRSRVVAPIPRQQPRNTRRHTRGASGVGRSAARYKAPRPINQMLRTSARSQEGIKKGNRSCNFAHPPELRPATRGAAGPFRIFRPSLTGQHAAVARTPVRTFAARSSRTTTERIWATAGADEQGLGFSYRIARQPRSQRARIWLLERIVPGLFAVCRLPKWGQTLQGGCAPRNRSMSAN